MASLENRVIALLSRSAMIPEKDVRLDSELESLGMGSLDQIECIMAIEEELKVELPIADLRKLRMVSDVVEAVRQAAADAGTR
jgi:acyl carrier protein